MRKIFLVGLAGETRRLSVGNRQDDERVERGWTRERERDGFEGGHKGGNKGMSKRQLMT